MKKIVALVLSLVMALSLCTVAFGATTVAYAKNMVTGKVEVDKTKAIDVKKIPAKQSAQGDGWVEYYVAKDGSATYIVCDKGDANFAIYTNNGFTTWVRNDLDEYAAYYEFAVTEQKATDKKATCDKAHFLDNGYLDKNGNFYVEADDAYDTSAAYANRVKVGSKVITVYDAFANFNYIAASHIFGEPKANDKTGYDEVTCLVCDGVFAATDDESVLTKNKVAVKSTFAYDVDDAMDVYNENDYGWAWGDKFADSYDYVWSLKAGTAAGTKDGVNSAKTFDAGIAMYVGMSLLSVAGGAVVIGKKKEF